MTTVNIDELLAARERLNAEKAAAGRVAAVAPIPDVTEDLTLIRLIGLWLLVTGLLILKVIANILVALAAVVEWLKREHDGRTRTRRRR